MRLNNGALLRRFVTCNSMTLTLQQMGCSALSALRVGMEKAQGRRTLKIAPPALSANTAAKDRTRGMDMVKRRSARSVRLAGTAVWVDYSLTCTARYARYTQPQYRQAVLNYAIVLA